MPTDLVVLSQDNLCCTYYLLVGLIGNFHIFDLASLPPESTRSPLYNTLYSKRSNTTLHPASVIFLVNIKGELAMPGTVWASAIVSGSQGMSRLHVCVE